MKGGFSLVLILVMLAKMASFLPNTQEIDENLVKLVKTSSFFVLAILSVIVFFYQTKETKFVRSMLICSLPMLYIAETMLILSNIKNEDQLESRMQSPKKVDVMPNYPAMPRSTENSLQIIPGDLDNLDISTKFADRIEEKEDEKEQEYEIKHSYDDRYEMEAFRNRAQFEDDGEEEEYEDDYEREGMEVDYPVDTLGGPQDEDYVEGTFETYEGGIQGQYAADMEGMDYSYEADIDDPAEDLPESDGEKDDSGFYDNRKTARLPERLR